MHYMFNLKFFYINLYHLFFICSCLNIHVVINKFLVIFLGDEEKTFLSQSASSGVTIASNGTPVLGNSGFAAISGLDQDDSLDKTRFLIFCLIFFYI